MLNRVMAGLSPVLALAVCGVAGGLVQAGTPVVERVAVSGMAAPGTDRVFSGVMDSFAIRGGVVAFGGTLPWKGFSLNDGVWLYRNGTLEKAVLGGEMVEGGGSLWLGYPPLTLHVNAGGDVVFANVTPGIVAKYTDSNAPLSVLGNVNPAPGTNSSFLQKWNGYITDSGRLLATASLASGGGGIWQREKGGSLEPLLITGYSDPVHGFTYTQVHDNIELAGEKVIHSAQVMMGDGSKRNVIVSHSGGDTTLLVKQGDSVPGAPGYYWNSVTTAVSANERGSVLYRGYAMPTAGGGVGMDVLMLATPEGEVPVVMGGSPVPGKPGSTFHSLGRAILGENDRAIFKAVIDLTREGVFSTGLTADPVPIAMKGDPAVGFGSGWIYSDLWSMDLTDYGGAVFSATVAKGQDRRDALYMQDPSGVLHLVAYGGQSWDLGPGLQPGVVRSIRFADETYSPQELYISGNTAVFRLGFADNRSGIFTVTMVPEPASVALLGLGAVALLRRRR